jgi:transposase-like protein
MSDWARNRCGMILPPVSDRRHRFPPQIIAHAGWLCFRFPLRLRVVEEMLLERGIVVSYKAIRRGAINHPGGPALEQVWPSHTLLGSAGPAQCPNDRSGANHQMAL